MVCVEVKSSNVAYVRELDSFKAFVQIFVSTCLSWPWRVRKKLPVVFINTY